MEVKKPDKFHSIKTYVEAKTLIHRKINIVGKPAKCETTIGGVVTNIIDDKYLILFNPDFTPPYRVEKINHCMIKIETYIADDVHQYCNYTSQGELNFENGELNIE